MATFTATLDGQQHMIGALHAWEARKHREIGALITRTAGAIADEAAREAPKRTGGLRESIRAVVEKALTDLVGDIVAGVFYARMVELGTKTSAAHPFLFPVWERHAHAYYADLRSILAS